MNVSSYVITKPKFTPMIESEQRVMSTIKSILTVHVIALYQITKNYTFKT